ncbi:MAG: CpXC domain-containing protein [Kiritimatiellales bacterium]|nr:CpXC domain-containing protein [Kiritimatiellota bacterium]MBL7011661.1 CpXC domain-containing protein [Kiritimatiellales bacterium]
MSAQKTYSIRCPQCNHTQNAELYESINVAQQPELKKALFENRLNRVVCEACKASFRLDKPLLYHDPDRNILIHWMPDNAVSRDEILDEFDKSMEELRAALPEGMEPPRVRLVFDRVELVELIFIIEAGMDERVVEYIKYTVHAQNPSRLPPAKKQLLLNVQDSTADDLLFAIRDLETAELEDILRYPREAYRGVQKMYRDNPSEFEELFPGPYINARTTLLAEEVEDSEGEDTQ